jgi:hypothetical protein
MSFFVLKSEEDLEKEWDHLMWQEYIIKTKGYSRTDIYAMPAEERKWIITRIEEEHEKMKRGARGRRQL